MPWCKRKRGCGRGYYYLSYREGEKRVKRYVGKGTRAEEIAAQVAEQRERRLDAQRVAREERLQVEPAEEASEAYEALAGLLVHALLLDAGYYRHKRQWRKRRTVMDDAVKVTETECDNTGGASPARGKRVMKGKRPHDPLPSPAPPPTFPRPKTRGSPHSSPKATTQLSAQTGSPAKNPSVPALSPSDRLQAVVGRANAGDREALAELRLLLDTHPEIWRTMGDLSRLAELAWIDLVAAGNLLTAESVKRKIQDLKSDLSGPSPDMLETLLVEQVAITWLAARQAERDAATQGGTSHQLAVLRLKRAESAGKRHLTAIRTFATVRALLPSLPGQTEGGTKSCE
jgi:hypothetical protein